MFLLFMILILFSIPSFNKVFFSIISCYPSSARGSCTKKSQENIEIHQTTNVEYNLILCIVENVTNLMEVSK